MSEQDTHLFSQVDQQVANGQLATVLVERKDGSIQTGQLEAGMGEDRTAVVYGDSGKMVGNEKLTDQYQEHLARQLAGAAALRGSAIESPGEQVVAKKEKPSIEVMNKARTEADMKYNQVKNLGGSHEEAEAAANRVWKHYGI